MYGGLRGAWSARATVINDEGWDVKTRCYDLNGASLGGVEIVNSTTKGDQFVPKLGTIGSRQFVVWTSFGQDGSNEGVFGRLAYFPGGFDGNEFQVNTRSINKQIDPTVSAVPGQKIVVAWSSFVGGVASFDLFAQRYSVGADAGLPQPPSLFVGAVDQHSVTLSWPEIAAQNVATLLIYVDGEAVPVETQNSLFHNITRPEWLPSSTHSFQLAYRLGMDVSPKSDPSSGTTWGADTDGDGLPDNWQSQYWGIYWPTPEADDDGDGATNREEFFAGTNPRDRNSVLRMNLSSRERGVSLEWNTPAWKYLSGPIHD